MTVPVNAVKKTVSCDGQTRTWQFNFPLSSQESIEVWVKPPQGDPYKVTDHVVLDRESDEEYTYVTYPALSSGLSPLGSEYKLVFERVTPLTQEVTFATHVLPETFTQSFDKTTLQIQNLDEKISRCVRFDPDPTLTASDTNATLFMSSVLTQAQNTIQTAAAEVTNALSTHNASESAHSDIRSTITQSTQTWNSALSQEQNLRQNGDGALQLSLNNLSGQLSQEVSNRQDGDDELQTQITSQGEAISALQTAISGKQAAGDYVTQSSLTTALAGKQNTLSPAQLAAVNSGVTSDTVAQVQTNKEAISTVNAALDASKPWQRPADWVDIRSGALENSIYLLVAHSLPTESEGVYTVATYPQFHVTCRTSTNTNTYDVFVDGMKVATTAWDEKTVLDWATLYGAGTVSTIYTTTHPSELVYHIVRIAPTVSTDTLTKLRIDPDAANIEQGVLWVHYQLSNPIRIAQAFGGESRPRNSILEAVTAKNNKITYTVSNTEAASGFYATFAECTSLVQIPVLEAENKTYPSGQYLAFRNTLLKKIVIKNNHGGETFALINYVKAEDVEVENGLVFRSATTVKGSATHPEKLKRLPAVSTNSGESLLMGVPTNLQDTFIDDSANTERKYLRIYGISNKRVPGLKGLLVSNAAPFDGASPQIQIDYTGLNRAALVALFNSLPTVNASQVCSIVGAEGAADLTTDDLTIATAKGWTVTR